VPLRGFREPDVVPADWLFCVLRHLSHLLDRVSAVSCVVVE
jgi:hypothetical protein